MFLIYHILIVFSVLIIATDSLQMDDNWKNPILRFRFANMMKDRLTKMEKLPKSVLICTKRFFSENQAHLVIASSLRSNANSQTTVVVKYD